MMQAHEEAVQKLQHQHQTELAGQSSQINDLQQCLAEKTQRLDQLATDHSDALEVCFPHDVPAHTIVTISKYVKVRQYAVMLFKAVLG